MAIPKKLKSLFVPEFFEPGPNPKEPKYNWKENPAKYDPPEDEGRNMVLMYGYIPMIIFTVLSAYYRVSLEFSLACCVLSVAWVELT